MIEKKLSLDEIFCFIKQSRIFKYFFAALFLLTAVFSQAQSLSTSEKKDSRPRQLALLASKQVDQIDPRSGNLTIQHRDLVLPGNGGMDIEVWRTYNMLGMSSGLVSTHTQSFRGAALGPGWSLGVAPRITFNNTYYIEAHNTIYYYEHTLRTICRNQNVPGAGAYELNAAKLELPDGSSHDLFFVSSYTLRTKNGWKVTCISNQISATAPNGTQYNFGHIDNDLYIGKMAIGPHDYLIEAPDPDQVGSELQLPTRSVSYLVAKTATDTNGNQLSFTYQMFGTAIARWNVPGFYNGPALGQGSPSSPAQIESPSLHITKISASDGRSVTFAYDATTGRLTSATDHTGRIWKYSYLTPDANNDRVLSKVTLPTGESWNYGYAPGPFGESFNPDPALVTPRKLTSLTYPGGGNVTYQYGYWHRQQMVTQYGSTWSESENQISAGEQIVRKTLSTGESWSYAYTPGSTGQYDTTTETGPTGTTTYKFMGVNYAKRTNINWSTDPKENNVWRIGQLMEKTYPSGAKETYVWAPRLLANIGAIVRELGVVVDEKTWVADLTQKTITQDGATYTTTYSNYDTYGNPGTVTETGPNGGSRTTTLTYLNDTTKWIIGKRKDESFAGGSITRSFDTKGNLLSATENGVTTSYTYDAQGNVATKTLPRGLIHQYSNYKHGIPQTETQPEGITISRVVDNAGNVTSETNGEGKTTTYTYDGLNRVKSETYPLGLQKTIAYTATSKTATRGAFVETTQYNGFGEVSSINNGGITTTFTYDGLGRKTFESYPNSTSGTSYAYDALNRITRITNGDSTYQSYSYGAGSIAITNERNYTTTQHYRSYGNPNEKHLVRVDAPDPSANIVINRNARDQVTSVVQAGLTRTYGYNTNYYLTSVINPETGTTTYGRDIAGNMTSSKVGTSGTTIYTYDNQNRLTKVTYPDTTPAVTHTYNKINDLLSSSSTDGNRGFVYDANGNIKLESLQIGSTTFSLSYDYNGNDHLSSITYPLSRRVVNYAPDVLGRPTQVSGYATSVSYWPSGLLKQVNYTNGTITQYNQNNRLWPNSFRTYKSGSADYFNSSYGYDGVGNLTSIYDSIDSSYSRTLGYDSIDRLVTANGPWGSGTINYDGAGNVTRQSLGSWNINYSYSSNNVLGSISGSRTASYGYDVYGNQASNGSNNYTYNANSNLKCINCSTSGAINFSYDGTNQRSAIIRGNNTVTYEMYNSKGMLMLEEFAFGQTYRFVEYIYLDNKRIAEHEGTKISYFHNDISGSPMLATNASGAQLWKETYRPYGDKLKQEAASSSNKIGFHGKPFDNDVGLSYMGARYYDPTLGRFTGIDPVDFQEKNLHSFNRYAYANNNPYKFVDPDGKLPILLIPVITFVAKEVMAEVASQATGGATDFLSTRRMATKAGSFAVSKLSAAVQTANKEIAKKGTGSVTQKGKTDFIVSAKGTAMSTNKDYNLVDSKEKGGSWFQIHNTHSDAKAPGGPHTHYPEKHDKNTTREIKETTGNDMDKADAALKSGDMRERINRQDRGGI